MLSKYLYSIGCVSVVVMAFMCVSNLQGPQGFTGPPGEPGEAGASVSITNTGPNTHLHCTLVARRHSHIVFVSFSTGCHGSPWRRRPPWKERRGCEWTGSAHIHHQYFSLDSGFVSSIRSPPSLCLSFSFRVSLANLVAPVSVDPLAHR